MLQNLLKKVPHREDLLKNPVFKWLKPILGHKFLWCLNRKTISNGVFVGIIAAFTPWPIQMIQALIMSVFLRANLPTAITFAWVSNPLTIGPLFYLCYYLGTILLGTDDQHNISFEISWSWLTNVLVIIWQPLLLGCFVIGIMSACTAWLTIRFIWKYQVIKSRAKQGENT